MILFYVIFGEVRDMSGILVAIIGFTLTFGAFVYDHMTVSVGSVEAKGSTNVIPERVTCDGTMRAFSEKLRQRVKDMITNIVEEIEYKHDVEVQLDVREGYPCVENDMQLTYEAMLLSDSLGYQTKDLEMRTTSEDFGYYTQLYPSLFYRLGVGRNVGRAHTATFLPDDKALEIGEEFMYRLALSILNK